MSAPGPGAGVTVLVAAAGASWEATALERVQREPTLVLARRCLDLTDLLAAATTGTGSVALVSAALPGLDADSVRMLGDLGVGLVMVAGPDELADGDAERMRRLGVEHLLATSELDSLVSTLRETGSVPTPVEAAGPAGASDAFSQDRTVPSGRDPDGASGRVVAVWGPTGAPGRTTVAVGLASELASAGHDALLLDLDAYGGAVAQHLGILDEVSGLLAAARAANAGELDVDRLALLARGVGERLRVLTGLPRPERWREVRPSALQDVVDHATSLATYVVLDLGFGLEGEPPDPFGPAQPQRNQMTLDGLDRADELVVVGAADPVGLARLARGLVEVHALRPDLRPRVVLNRTRPTLGWAERELRAMVEGFLAVSDVHFLPDDRPGADRALMAGVSLAESGDSPLRAAMRTVAAGVAGGSLGHGSRGRPRVPRLHRRGRHRGGSGHVTAGPQRSG